MLRKEVRIPSRIDHEERFSDYKAVRAAMLWWDDSPAKQWDKQRNTARQPPGGEQSKKLFEQKLEI